MPQYIVDINLLPTTNMAHMDVTDANFEEEVLKSDKPVFVDFWAPWCGPCHMLAPVIDELDEKHGDKVKVVKMNSDDNQITPANYAIRGIPTVILFQNGEAKATIVGVHPLEDYEEALKSCE